jgi:pimeloyl-ACP methyl ester carboxylesterase
MLAPAPPESLPLRATYDISHQQYRQEVPMTGRIARCATLAALVFAAGCGDRLTRPPESVAALAPESPSLSLTIHPTSGPFETIFEGERGTKSVYRLYMPSRANWNGKLVVYAHGIVAPYIPVALPTEGESMAAIFGSQGFAVAMSSYDETGLAIRDGTRRTHEMRGLFSRKFARPARTYLAGSSMGGFIVAKLGEEHGGEYDGVLPMCGVVGGFPAEFSYVLNARVLFDLFYQGVLPGSPYEVTPAPRSDADAMAIQNAAGGAFAANPVGGIQIALMDQSRIPLPTSLGGPLTDPQFGEFVVTPQVLHAVFINDIVMHARDKFPISNMGVTYSSSSPLAPTFLPGQTLSFINAHVQRVDADPAGVKWVERYGDTSGELAAPTLTLHTRYDTWVPREQEDIYRAKVKAEHRSRLLVQRTTEGFGHCNFTAGEIYKGLADLDDWVENGVKPTP